MNGAETDPWHALRRFTPARIALGRAGAAQPTHALLDFALAHARARDAVQAALDVEAVTTAITALGFDVLHITSAATDRPTYLARPDLGRQLSDVSDALLHASVSHSAMPSDRADPHQRHAEKGDRRSGLRPARGQAPQVRQTGEAGCLKPGSEEGVSGSRFDLAIVVGDGLSSPAVERNAAPLLAALIPWIAAASWRVAPIVLATQARVALGDAVAANLGASAVLTLIGERPGLSAPDGLGAYLTFGPAPGATRDAGRNCLSNIRPGGMDFDQAAFRIAWLLGQAFARRLTGIALKDESDRLILEGRLPEPRRLGPRES